MTLPLGSTVEDLERLARNFAYYVEAFDVEPQFGGTKLAAHRRCLELRRQLGSLSCAVHDEAFISSVVAVLHEWGLDRRGSKLVNRKEFSRALLKALPTMEPLESVAIDDDDLPADVPLKIWRVIYNLGVTKNKAKIVAGTKTLHHLLPDLVVPMDRTWTGRFFGIDDWQSGQRQTFLTIFRAFRFIATQAHQQKFVTGHRWRTSQTKLIDNAVMGYCRPHL